MGQYMKEISTSVHVYTAVTSCNGMVFGLPAHDVRNRSSSGMDMSHNGYNISAHRVGARQSLPSAAPAVDIELVGLGCPRWF